MRDDASDRPGAAVRGYRIVRFVGMGGAAALYEARRLGRNGPGERVACKVLLAHREGDPVHRELLRQEARVGMHYVGSHPNVVEVSDYFDDDEDLRYLVMELVDGASVAALCGSDRRLPFPVTRRVVACVLEALVHLHGRRVLHRDLSPSNILVTTDGAVKVTDFGLARVMEDGRVHTDTFRGTAPYASSEAINLLPLDVRADLFALGAILYELVAGMPPCGEQHMVGTVLARNAAGKFEPVPPDTPADLAELITGLVQNDREARRPQTAAEALALLRGHGQLMASPEELTALVVPAQSRRDQELADMRPAHMLPPGHVLTPRMTGPLVARRTAAPPALAVGGAAAAPPMLAAGNAAGNAGDAQPMPAREGATDAPACRVTGGADPAPPDLAALFPELVAQLRAELAAEEPPEPVTKRASDVVPGRASDGVPEPVTQGEDGPLLDYMADLMADVSLDDAHGRVAEERVVDVSPAPTDGHATGGAARPRPGGAGRRVARRVVAMAATGVCIVVIGRLLDDGFRGEPATIARQQPSEVPAPIAQPTPAPPIAPVPVTPTRVHRATGSADGRPHARIEAQSGNQPARERARRWLRVPSESQWPSWVQR
jgi:hypothetical protein